jgi:hypothetical protein
MAATTRLEELRKLTAAGSVAFVSKRILSMKAPAVCWRTRETLEASSVADVPNGTWRGNPAGVVAGPDAVYWIT